MKLVPVLSVVLLACSSPAFSQTFETPVTERFFEGEIRANSMHQTVYVFRWYPLDVDGRFAVCGVGYYRSNAFRTVVRGMARRGEFVRNGKSIPLDLSHFKRVRRADMGRSPATCRQTNIPVAGTQQVGIRFDSGVYGR